MRDMGKQRIVDKSITPQEVLYNLTPANAVEGRSRGSLGVIPLGYYRGGVAFWDLDLAVKQPLVLAEQLHILGILDGREEDYDLQTLAITAGEPIGTPHPASLTVPAGQVWFLNGVQINIPATVACSIGWNWYCSLWTDRAAVPSPNGQPFHGAEQNNGVGGPWVNQDEFGPIQTLFVIGNKAVLLRAPAGTIFTVVFTTRTALGEAISCTFQLFGFIGKSLVA